MSEENKIRDAAEAVKGALEAAPIYQDLVQPAAKVLGRGLETVARSITSLLLPLKAVVWGMDKIEAFLIPNLAEKLQHVPPEHLIAPHPVIAGPILEALRFTGDEPTLGELYAKLLATSMNSETTLEAHPAFVEIIKQLTPDEARIMRMFSVQHDFPIVTMRLESIDGFGGGKFVLNHYSILGFQAGCSYPELIESYIDHLSGMRLVEVLKGYRYTRPGIYELLENHPYITDLVSTLKKRYGKKPVMKRGGLQLTTWGQQFIDACIGRSSAADEEKPVEG